MFNEGLISKEASVNTMLSLRRGFAENKIDELRHCITLLVRTGCQRGAGSSSGGLGDEVKNHTAICVHNHSELATKKKIGDDMPRFLVP